MSKVSGLSSSTCLSVAPFLTGHMTFAGSSRWPVALSSAIKGDLATQTGFLAQGGHFDNSALPLVSHSNIHVWGCVCEQTITSLANYDNVLVDPKREHAEYLAVKGEWKADLEAYCVFFFTATASSNNK